MKSMPRITITVLSFNRVRLLRNLLQELRNLKYCDLEVIVVDNCSTDGTGSMVKSEFPDVIFHQTKENIGVGARNIGLRMATGELIVTLDDDIISFHDEDLESLVRFFSERKSLGAVNFKVIEPETGSLVNWVHHCRAEEYCDREFITYEITEGAVAFRKEALEKSGYYPEKFFISHEGPDLAFRLWDSGYEVIYSNVVTVKHFKAKEGRTAWRNYYYDTRNQYWLAGRNMPLGYALTYLARGQISMLVYSVRDGYFKYWLKAVYDGVKGLGETLRERKVLGDNTMKLLKEIDCKRPGYAYMIRKRLFQRKIGT